jgi:hypothetical protein
MYGEEDLEIKEILRYNIVTTEAMLLMEDFSNINNVPEDLFTDKDFIFKVSSRFGLDHVTHCVNNRKESKALSLLYVGISQISEDDKNFAQAIYLMHNINQEPKKFVDEVKKNGKGAVAPDL